MRKTLAVTLLLSAFVAGSAAGAPSVPGKALPPAPPPPPLSDEPLVCPTDARPCPDGSFVKRNPLDDCAFDACQDTHNN